MYGLTERGRELLSLERVEHERDYERLIARPDDAGTPDGDEIQRDAALGDWLIALLLQVGREPTLVGRQVQARYTLTDPDGEAVATLGALVVLAFDPLRRDPPRPWPLPWLGGEGRVLNWEYCYLVLEVDSGLGGRSALASQATAYRELSRHRYHGDLSFLNDMVRPVILAASEARVASIREVWADVWPGNPALVVTAHTGAASGMGKVLAAVLPPTPTLQSQAPMWPEPRLGQFS